MEEVDAKLHRKVTRAYSRVKETAEEYETDWRTGAYIVTLKRLEHVYKERGIFP